PSGVGGAAGGDDQHSCGTPHNHNLGVLCGELPSRRSIVETTKLATRRALFAAAAAILVLAPVALAAKGGNGPKGSNSTSSSSLTLQLVTDVNNDGPSWGDMVRFSVSNPPADPNVELLCSQKFCTDLIANSARMHSAVRIPTGAHANLPRFVRQSRMSGGISRGPDAVFGASTLADPSRQVLPLLGVIGQPCIDDEPRINVDGAADHAPEGRSFDSPPPTEGKSNR